MRCSSFCSKGFLNQHRKWRGAQREIVGKKLNPFLEVVRSDLQPIRVAHILHIGPETVVCATLRRQPTHETSKDAAAQPHRPPPPASRVRLIIVHRQGKPNSRSRNSSTPHGQRRIGRPPSVTVHSNYARLLVDCPFTPPTSSYIAHNCRTSPAYLVHVLIPTCAL